MIKKTITLLALLMGISALATAQAELLSYEQMTSFLSAEQKAELQDKGELTEFHFDGFDLKLLPSSDVTASLRSMVDAGELNMGIEGLFLYKDFDVRAYEANPEGEALKLYNILRSVSSLEGTQYYSASRGEMRDLFVESWMIPSLDKTRKKLDDPLVNSIPATDSILIHQRDKSFGRHESEMSFTYETPVIWTALVNKSPMFYKGVLKVINPDKMQIHLLILPTDEGLLFYGITGADTLSIKSFRERANASFYNRVKALYGWFSGKL